ncbi:MULTISPECIES: NAD(P)/FAD-dependent oxidoreductase [Kosmotoga]|uniref:FAD dependent oxidoreductase n=1 Tax=Kosmotoga olearia (strain ATCC BAA-1733 / DSM 21960 / TBF 19.5.1) TaxID=521045 RepID=C5CIF1_KOSOT|nr:MULTISPECIES: NAD(P)/FAD-dependent oxidoreductase [Kosmotoga]ACR78885.1 FAD dependent oxidoreductase [Kosmotoga olearia TBF 19.5.1]MDI3523982.1 glycerol-3-phosphate dehydrogenase [Kosmotoga sp.]MDK2954058.1 glycerol-3-phosphate dehydrogenase [Kosmotoga sp.]OAA24864.1 ferredoxin [Kosmotoga sp. DU53]
MRFAIIGGGVIGSLIAWKLSKYDVDVVLIEKKSDFGQGVTKANSAILHGGYDDPPGSLRARFCVLGNQMYRTLSHELGFEIKWTGSIVLARDTNEEIEKLKELMKKGEENGVKGLQIIDRNEIEKIQPGIAEDYKYALYCPTAGVTEPWEIAINAADGAALNGATLIRGDGVVGGEIINGSIKTLKLSSGKTIRVDVVINAAGLYYEHVANLFGARTPKVFLRKGQYILLDKIVGTRVEKIIFPLPNEKGKGKLVVPTVDGGVLLGPTSEDLPGFSPEDVSTTLDGIKEVMEAGEQLMPGLAKREWVIKSFAGLRPETKEKDFFIQRSEELRNFITVGAIRSPGLTAAPAIAKYVVEEIIHEEMGLALTGKTVIKYPEKKTRVKEKDFNELAEEISREPLLGKIICHCNQVSEKEIVEAIRDGATTIDGIKFRTRAGFGRCQGGFCGWKIARILARELNIDISEVLQNEDESWLVREKVRP